MDEETRYDDERAYAPPALTVLGTIEELTRAAQTSLLDTTTEV